MKAKTNASEKVRRRYLLISGEKEEIEKTILDYLGILGFGKARPVFIEKKGEKIILAVERNSINDIRASIELSGKKIKVIRVSGTIKGLKR